MPPGTSFNATHGSTANSVISVEGLTLRLQGYCFDTISSVEISKMDVDYIPSALAFFSPTFKYDSVCHAEWADACNIDQGQTYAPTGETIYDAFWHTSFLGMLGPELTPGNRIDIASLDNSLWAERLLAKIRIPGGWRQLGFLINLPLVMLNLWSFASEFLGYKDPPALEQHLTVTNGQKLIKTQSGYIGVTAGDAESGDQVVLLSGGKVPYLLRKIGRNEYEFIGDCYLHGVMYGQLWDADKCDEITLLK